MIWFIYKAVATVIAAMVLIYFARLTLALLWVGLQAIRRALGAI